MARKGNVTFNNDDEGIFLKQDSGLSVHNSVPISPSFPSLLVLPESPNEVNAPMKRNVSYGNMENRTEARVLVMYTGGTIGMLRNTKNGKKQFRELNDSVMQHCQHRYSTC